jgi:hypothetical protein
MKILNQDEIKLPRIRHEIQEGKTDADWHTDQQLLGGVTQREVLCPDRNWVDDITEYELQHNGLFDAYDCVTQGHWNGVQCIAKLKWKIILNESKRWTAIKAGTKPGRGTSVQAVSEAIRNYGGVPEEIWPSMSPTMTESEFYKPIPAEIDAQENFKKDGWIFNHEWVTRTNPFSSNSNMETCWNNLIYSPIVVCVDGDYRFNNNGELQYGGYVGPYIQYTHVVLLVGGEYGKYVLVLDSENPNGLMKVEWGYKFGYAKLLYLKKNNMPKLFKKIGEPAIYALNEEDNVLVPFADGVIPGGKLFKTLYGVDDYSKLPRTDVDELPYPIASYSFLTQ